MKYSKTLVFSLIAIAVISLSHFSLRDAVAINDDPAVESAVAADCPGGQCPGTHPVDCGSAKDGCCKTGETCCGDMNCCPQGKPHFCKRSGYCYKYYTEAEKDCGSNYVMCWRRSGEADADSK